MTIGKLIAVHCAGVEGPSLYIGREGGVSLRRVAGPKPWGGGRTIKKFEFSLEDLREALPELVITERHRG